MIEINERTRLRASPLSVLIAAFCALTLTLLSCQFAHAFTRAVAITIDDDDTPFVLDSSGSVWGYLQPDQLLQPIKLPNLAHIKQIVPFAALTKDGHVFTWDLKGPACPPDGYDGAQRRDVTYSMPHEIPGLNDVISIAGADRHFLALRADGTVVQFGAKLGAEGLAFFQNVVLDACSALPRAYRMPRPANVTSISGAIAVATDGGTDGVLSRNGFFYYWGFDELMGNYRWQNHDEDRIHKISVGTDKKSLTMEGPFIALLGNHQAYYWGACRTGGRMDSFRVLAGQKDNIANIDKILLGFDDNRNGYVLSDGRIVLDYVPGTIFKDSECSDGVFDKQPEPKFVTKMPVPAVDAVLPSFLAVSSLIVVGNDGSLWTNNGSRGLQGPIELTNIDLP